VKSFEAVKIILRHQFSRQESGEWQTMNCATAENVI